MAAKHVFFAIDACYSGLAFMRSGELNPDEQLYLEKASRFRTRQLITAGREGEQVLEEGGHGIFTKILLLALDGNADKIKPFGVLTGSELGSYLSAEVALATHNAQTPQFGRISPGEGQFLFVLPGYQMALPDTMLEAPKPIAFGHVQVNVTVPGSLVYVNGTYRGMASPNEPLELQNAGLGEVEVRVEAEGYQDLNKNVVLKPDGWTQEIFELPSISMATKEGATDVSVQDDMVHIADFYMDKYEVTNTQFAIFLNARGNKREGGEEWMKLDAFVGIESVNGLYVVRATHEKHPVVQVSWYGAKAFCKWAEKRLPTEKEWQRACQGQSGRIYPWGADFDAQALNVKGMDRHPRTAPVGFYASGASDAGILDLAGNVWEWTDSLAGRKKRIIRGGAWSLDGDDAKCTSRDAVGASEQGLDVGFRCVR
jgi:hypothetical protein